MTGAELLEETRAPECFECAGQSFALHPWLREFKCRRPALYEFEQVVGTLQGVMLRIETFYPPTRYKDAYATFVRRMRGQRMLKRHLGNSSIPPSPG
jgi:hypothetical protein